ncbi:MAG: nicotinamide riboside transporter PnuC [Gemmatimonadaceae bacterium]
MILIDIGSVLRENWLEIAAVTTGALSVYLSVREKVANWPVGIVNVALYALFFWRVKLYADMGLQVVYFVLSFYGWYEWLYGGSEKTALPITRGTPELLIRVSIIGFIAAAVLGTILARYTDAALPFLDSSLTATSLVAQYLITVKKIENWLFWLAADVVYVGLFIFKGVYLTAALYGLFLVLAAIGYVAWKRTLLAQPALA